MIVAVDAVAEAVGRRFRGQRDGAHDLADVAAAAEPVPVLGHPSPHARRVGVELVGAGIDRGPLGPADRDLGRHDVAPMPFLWTAPAADILEEAARGRQALESAH